MFGGKALVGWGVIVGLQLWNASTGMQSCYSQRYFYISEFYDALGIGISYSSLWIVELNLLYSKNNVTI